MNERTPGWSVAGGTVMVVGVGAAVGIFTTVADHSTWEKVVASLCVLLTLLGLYWMIAALVGWPPFQTWTFGPQRHHPHKGTSASASPSGGLAVVPPVTVRSARFGRGDQRKWENVTDVVRSKLIDGELHIHASVAGLGVDPAAGFRKVLRIKYKVGGSRTIRAEYPENEPVVLP